MMNHHAQRQERALRTTITDRFYLGGGTGNSLVPLQKWARASALLMARSSGLRNIAAVLFLKTPLLRSYLVLKKNRA